MSTIPRQLRRLIDLGRSQGYVTHEQINDAMPLRVSSSSAIDAWLTTLGEHGIAILEQAPGATAPSSPLAQFDDDDAPLGEYGDRAFDLRERLATFAQVAGVAVSALEDLLRPCWRFSLRRRWLLRRGTSHVGGRPHVPRGFEWPREGGGRPLTFFAQLDCARHVLPRLPDHGSLVLFVTVDDEPSHDELAVTSGPCSMQWFACAASALRAASPPRDLARRATLDQYGAVGIPGMSLPTSADLAWSIGGRELPEVHAAEWDALCSDLHEQGAPDLAYGGYAQPLQADPRLEVTREAAGLDDKLVRLMASHVRAGRSLEDAQVEAVAQLEPELTAADDAAVAQARKWTHVLQFQTAHSRWCYVQVPTADLAVRRFDRARLVVQQD